MGLFSEEIQKTSVSLYIERLSNLEEVDWYLLQQLIESIQMQESGAREAVETVRKKLKHGGPQQKLRVLEVLKLLMENSSQQFHRQFLANEKMKERFEIILSSPSESPAVKKELVSLLATWSSKYKNEPGMKALGDLYDLGRGHVRRTRPRANTDTTSNASSSIVQSPTTPPTREINPPRTPSPPITKEQKRRSLPPPRPQQQQEPKITKARSQSNLANTNSSRTTRVFNFEKAKPKILEEIALANSNANNLVNALKLINTSEDRWEIELQHDRKLQEFHDKCEDSKKRIVRYARLVENEEWIGTLLATNEDLLKALEMYDIMLAGEIPAAWSLGQQRQQQLPATNTMMIGYYSTTRSPPPPPPNRLRIENSFSNMRIEPEEELDPFADPTTPIEEGYNRREYM